MKISYKIILTGIEDETHALNGLHAPDEELICFKLRPVFKLIFLRSFLLVFSQHHFLNFPQRTAISRFLSVSPVTVTHIVSEWSW